ncbi:hypothetical protein ACFQZE_07475 [Paenibacillus sp. GCM10027627]|uniref:hypothetical protein n=1 Tax=unclassified Paenibacillus TaxID=185978 RepID=UPI003631979D
MINSYEKLIYEYRSGKEGDEFPRIDATSKIINNKILSEEVPDRIQKVQVQGYVELPALDEENPTIESNQYLVNYNNGEIFFNPSENGKTVFITYWGTGLAFFPASRVYTKTLNGEVVETLETFINKAEDALGSLNGAEAIIQNAVVATNAANASATEANAKAAYANTQGDYAKAKGDEVNAIGQATDTVRIAIESNEQARISAESLRISAEQLRHQEESAREVAENSRIDAETIRISSETSRISAESQRSASEVNRVTNEDSRVSAESARSTNETDRLNNESNRESSETNRVNAETQRTDAEQLRQESEITRIGAEQTRLTSETSRVSNENVRSTAETQRVLNEDTRISSETARTTNETFRESNEALRTNDETSRQNAETGRSNNESDRMSAENSRAASEMLRISTETTRVTNETARENSETIRLSNEITRQSQESTRQTNTSQAIADTVAIKNDVQAIIDNTKGVGVYNSATEYKKNNIVTYNGSTFMALTTALGVTPVQGTQWQLLAQKGTDGTGTGTLIESNFLLSDTEPVSSPFIWFKDYTNDISKPNKNIEIKQLNEGIWNNYYPITNAENVKAASGVDLDNVVVGFKTQNTTADNQWVLIGQFNAVNETKPQRDIANATIEVFRSVSRYATSGYAKLQWLIQETGGVLPNMSSSLVLQGATLRDFTSNDFKLVYSYNGNDYVYQLYTKISKINTFLYFVVNNQVIHPNEQGQFIWSENALPVSTEPTGNLINPVVVNVTKEQLGLVGLGLNSRIEGTGTTATSDSSHAEGYYTFTGFSIFGFQDIDVNNKTVTVGSSIDLSSISVGSKVDFYSIFRFNITITELEVSSVNNTTKVITFTSFPNLSAGVISSTKVGGKLNVKNNYTGSLYSHAEGRYTSASGDFSHAEGDNTIAIARSSHAEGTRTVALGDHSHVEGIGNIASGSSSHAQGFETKATGDNSHSEGYISIASGQNAHAEGYYSVASGDNSHAQNIGAIAQGKGQTVIGQFNIPQGTKDQKLLTDHAFIIGNGSDEFNRSNAFAVRWDGSVEFTALAIDSLANNIVNQYDLFRSRGATEDNTDFNTLVQNGMYECVINSTYQNSPVLDVVGILEVIKVNSYAIQKFTDVTANETHQRTFNGVTWTVWKVIS